MERPQLTENSKIVILGSKPGSQLPFAQVSVAIGANNAVERAAMYRNHFDVYVIGIVPFVELQKQAHICQSFTTACPDEIVVLGGQQSEVEKFVRTQLNLPTTTVTVLSLHQINWSLTRHFGWRRFLLAFTFLRKRGVGHFIRFVIPDLLRGADMEWMNRSTGLNQILYVREFFPEAKQILMGGIGLQAGEHFTNEGQFTGKTAAADKLTEKFIPKSLKRMVVSTDAAAVENAGFSRWEGQVFSDIVDRNDLSA